MSEKIRHTRESIAERTQREFEQLDALVSRLREADWKRLVPRPETRAPWNVKDALVHIVYWKTHTVRVFRGERRPSEVRGLEVPQINDVIHKQWRERSPAEVLAWHREVHADVMRTLTEMPEDFFSRREHRASWPADFDGHSAAHRVKDIEAALDLPPRAPGSAIVHGLGRSSASILPALRIFRAMPPAPRSMDQDCAGGRVQLACNQAGSRSIA